MKTVFTTGEAAKICKVSQQTIIRCFDNGQLKGLPGARQQVPPHPPGEPVQVHEGQRHPDRRPGKSGKRKVLLVDDDVDIVEMIHKALDEDGRFEVKIAGQRVRRRHDGERVPAGPHRPGRDAAGY